MGALARAPGALLRALRALGEGSNCRQISRTMYQITRQELSKGDPYPVPSRPVSSQVSQHVWIFGLIREETCNSSYIHFSSIVCGVFFCSGGKVGSYAKEAGRVEGPEEGRALTSLVDSRTVWHQYPCDVAAVLETFVCVLGQALSILDSFLSPESKKPVHDPCTPLSLTRLLFTPQIDV